MIIRDYLVECIEIFGELFNGGASTPARANLFEIVGQTNKNVIGETANYDKNTENLNMHE